MNTDYWMPTAADIAGIAPLWALVGTIVALLVAALAVGRNWRVAAGVVSIGAAITALLAWRGFNAPVENWAGFAPTGSAPMLVADQFSSFFILLLSVFMILVTGLWWLGQNSGLSEQLLRKGDSTEFFVLLAGSAFGMALMVSTTNLLMIILAVEMASLPSYGITAFRKTDRKAAEASLKYVLFGAVTSAIMIYGASLLYGHYHTLDLARIGAQIAAETRTAGPSILMGVSLCAFMVGVAFKVSAVPFHFWCPDVFEGASIEVTTWLSVVSKAAGLGLLLRIIAVLTWQLRSPEALEYVTQAIAVMAAITCTVGNLSAFRQTNLKRLLAFSSIAHAGYMLMAVAVIWKPTGSPLGVAHPAFSAIIAYIIVYLLMNYGAFGVIAMVYWSTGRETIDAVTGLARRSLPLTIAMAVCLFSLVGLPPLGGFIAKYFLLAVLIQQNLEWLVVVAVINTLISLYYYVRIIREMTLVDDGQPAVQAPLLGQALVAICALLIVYTGTVGAGWLKGFADRRSENLYAVVKPSTPADQSEAANDSVDSPTAANVARAIVP